MIKILQIISKRPLSAVNQDKGKTCVNKISRHIKDGSNSKYSECWISACKKFEICATEFSIPQLGKYNTATNRKQIAVIYGKQTKGNFTYLEGTNDMNIVLKADTGRSFQCWDKVWGQLCSVDQLILDLSYPYTHKKTNFEEYSFGDWIKNDFIKKLDGKSYQGVPGIPSGNVKAASEVLILNEIPISSIKKILSFLETDILYALDNDTFESTLDDIICSKTIISIQNNHININGNIIILTPNEQQLVDKLYVHNNSMIDLAYDAYINRGSNNIIDILQIYNEFKKLKRGIIKKAVYSIFQNDFNVRIVEDEIYVAVKNISSPNCNNRIKLCKYDLLMIGDLTNRNLHKFSDLNYSKIWNESLNCSFIIMDNNNNLIDCSFE